MPRRGTGRTVAPTTAVGRVGRLTLEYVRQGERTVFGRTNCRTPWHLLPPIYLDETGSAYTLLVNPSGGLVEGDQLTIDLTVGSKAHVLISTPSANKVYRSLSQTSVQDIRISVGPEGILEWLPEHTIPFAGSRFRQIIDVKLAPGATLLLWDAVASGRIASGERWAFTSLENRIQIKTASSETVSEHYAFVPSTRSATGLAEEWDYMGSLFIIGDAMEAGMRDSLETVLADILEKRHGAILGAVSQPAAPGLVVKLLARSAPPLADVSTELWGATRRTLWNLPPVDLRKY